MGNNLPAKKGITEFLNMESVKSQVNQAVGKNAMRFMSSVISAVTVNPALQECTNPSILSAALLGESLNLSPSPQLGQYYMVPFEDKAKGKVAQFIMGYKGYIQLAIRSGQYKKLNVFAIKEGELVRFDPLTEEIEVRLIEDEEQRENAKTIGYYAMFEYVNGFKKAMYWSKAKMLSHADRYSAAFSKDGYEYTIKSGRNKGEKRKKVSFADFEAGNYPKDDEWMYSSFWYKDFDGMAYKTMLRQLISKWGIMSIEMQQAYVNDSAVAYEDGIRYPDEQPDEPEDVIIDTTVSEGAMDAFAGVAQDGHQELNLEGGADGTDRK
ncbi:MAG: recombinase RecT [Lachnospiraceae bacterium]|nr:recombinase RecT [Bacteroides fragilis]MCM1219001.1 recombinase RecT [Lachnospiraceae bacterium]